VRAYVCGVCVFSFFFNLKVSFLEYVINYFI
jgi:hypothetical protein